MDYTRRAKGVRYLGGKGKCGEIVRIINQLTRGGGCYWEPFLGSGKVMQSVRAERRYGSDIDVPMISLLRAIRGGWNPPTEVSEADYQKWRKRRNKPEYALNPMLGFVGYGCSFGARYFEGYARSKDGSVNFAASARAALLRQRPFMDIGLYISDYRQMPAGIFEPDVIYCDPPYEGTKPCGSVQTPFDSAEFWRWAVAKSKESIVLVSEYNCPLKQAVVLWQKSIAKGIRSGTGGDGGAKGDGKRKVEKLFCLNPDVGKDIGLGLF